MRKLFTMTCCLFAAAAMAAAIAVRLSPGLSAPGIADGVNRWIVSPARFLVTGSPATLIFTR